MLYGFCNVGVGVGQMAPMGGHFIVRKVTHQLCLQHTVQRMFAGCPLLQVSQFCECALSLDAPSCVINFWAQESKGIIDAANSGLDLSSFGPRLKDALRDAQRRTTLTQLIEAQVRSSQFVHHLCWLSHRGGHNVFYFLWAELAARGPALATPNRPDPPDAPNIYSYIYIYICMS